MGRILSTRLNDRKASRTSQYICMIKKNFIENARRQSKKDELVRQIESTAAATTIDVLREKGFIIDPEYLDTVVRMLVRFEDGHVITLQVDYRYLVGNADPILALLEKLR